MVPTGFPSSSSKAPIVQPPEEQEKAVAPVPANAGPSIFKVQEVGTAKFKCLPVTDYGKIMNLHKQRQQR